jgi:hypothetical protein
MAKSDNVIRIPKLPQDAYNQHRPVSELLWEQVEHLAAVVKRDIDDQRRAIRTEGQASAFIKKMTAILHPEGAEKPPASKSARKKAPASSKSAKKKPARSAKG